MAEVCSGTFPQTALPCIYEHPEFRGYLQERVAHYERLAGIATEILSSSKYLTVSKPKGAFYISAVFKDGVLNNKQRLPIEIKDIENYINGLLSEKDEYDKRFAYYLLASTGICVVPLTSFFTTINGFRLVLLEKSADRFTDVLKRIVDAVDLYIEGD
jgi:aspartate/methionine/tyrosine aminotransferase